MEFVILIITSYLLGAIPFAYLIGKYKGIDITKVGSGNVGTTNIWRELGWKWGVLNLLTDTAKGFMAITLVNILFTTPLVGYYIIAGSLAILGHYKSVWIHWKGGKAVATSLGVLLGLLPFWFIVIVVGIFGLTILLSRQVSLGSISAAIVAVIAKIILGGGFNQANFAITTFIIGIAMLIIIAHRDNIGRIMRGQERKI